jgi:hypothetical protein
MTRVLVTGSRSWDDLDTIVTALNEAWWATKADEEFVVVHGDAIEGADRMADNFARMMKWKVDPHPADWKKYGKRAGPIRNIEMVKAGADICLAFIRNESRGASQCADAAQAAGIPTRRYRA